MDPLELEWGTATPEFVSDDSSTAIHVINHSLTDSKQLQCNVAFIRGRVAFFARQIPQDMRQHIIFDDRGQEIPNDIRNQFRNAVEQLASFEFLTERI